MLILIFVSREGSQKFLGEKLSEEEVAEKISKADCDVDGKINIEEFMRACLINNNWFNWLIDLIKIDNW